MTIPSSNTLGYQGLKERDPPNVRYFKRAPTVNDISGFDIGDFWIDTVLRQSWQLMNKAAGVADWRVMAAIAGAVNLTPSGGGPVAPVANNIDLLGDGNGIQTANGGPGTLNIVNTFAFTPDGGVPVNFVVGNLAIDGAAGIAISNGGAGTITISPSDDLAAIEALATTGVVSRSAANTWVTSSITDHAVIVGDAGQKLSNIGPLTDGQLLIGSTGLDPVAASLTSVGGSIAITPGAGTINIESAGGVATTYTAEDTTTCSPVLGNLNIVGTATNGISTTAAVDTLTISMESPYADGDFAFTNSVAATPRTVSIENTDNDPGSYAALSVTTPTAGADPFLLTGITGTQFYSIGIDNSVAGDPWKLTNNVNPSTGDAIIASTSAGVITLFNDLDVSEGGTGVSTLTAHGVLLGNGASDIQALGVGSNGTVLIGNTGADPAFSATPSVTSITIANAPSAGTDGTNKTYVDAIASGIKFKNTVKAASTAPLTTLYDNGIAGVGATLTNNDVLAAFAIDGYNASLTDRILIKDQANAFENGIYTVTTLGSGAVAWVLTRATDYDTPAEMAPGSLVPVQFGTVNLETFWLQTTTVVTVGVDAVSYNQFSASLPMATLTQAKEGTSTTTIINPSTLTGYAADLKFTGFLSWSAGGPYFDDTTLGTFDLLVGGTGYIQGKLITWAAQNITGMTAGNTYYIYIDNTGTIQKTATRTDALYTDNIVLFECLRDSTTPTNNQVTVKEDHPYNYSATVSNYEHGNIGVLIENNQNGANIVLNGTQGIQINGADVLSDHGLETIIPDSGGSAVIWNKKYTTAAGKWALQNATNTFTGFWNNAGTPTALTANRFAVYTLYVSKDNLNSTTPVYFAVLDTSQYGSQAAANTAIGNGTTAKISAELAQLELAQLGYIIYRESTSAISSVLISKKTLSSSTSTSGTNQASLVLTNTTNFNGWLSAADTNVQAALDTLDDVLKGGTSGQLVASNGAATMPTYTTAVYPKTTAAGEMIYSNAANTVISGSSLSGDFTYTTATAGATRTVTISNSDNSNAASHATVAITTGGANGGDAKLALSTTTTAWSLGIDNSVTVPTADTFVISQNAALGTNNIMSVATTGAINYPLQPSFSAFLGGTVPNKTGQNTSYTLGTDALTEIYDQGSNFSGTTFTAPVTGRYLFSAMVTITGCTVASSGTIDIVTSNRQYYSSYITRPPSSSDFAITLTQIADMDAGDTTTFAVATTGEAANTDDIAGSASNVLTGIQGHLLC